MFAIIYVFDEIHLLTHSGFDFQQSVQYETAEIPCTPTHPNVSVSLSLQGRGPVNVDNKYITFSPKVNQIQINKARHLVIRLYYADALSKSNSTKEFKLSKL